MFFLSIRPSIIANKRLLCLTRCPINELLFVNAEYNPSFTIDALHCFLIEKLSIYLYLYILFSQFFYSITWAWNLLVFSVARITSFDCYILNKRYQNFYCYDICCKEYIVFNIFHFNWVYCICYFLGTFSLFYYFATWYLRFY